MITAGVDIGNKTIKAVCLRDGLPLSYSITLATEASETAGEKALQEALRKADLSLEDLDGVIATGSAGKDFKVSHDYVVDYITEVTCAVKGANELFPTARTVINLGVEITTVAICDEAGTLLEYEQNQKCASGSGLFLELVAEALEITVGEMGELASHSKKDVSLTNTCAVFAESEVVSLVSLGTETADVLKAVHNSVAERVVSMVSSLGSRNDIAFLGGVARNSGVVDAIAKRLGVDILVPEVPEIVAALGAALEASELKEAK